MDILFYLIHLTIGSSRGDRIQIYIEIMNAYDLLALHIHFPPLIANSL